MSVIPYFELALLDPPTPMNSLCHQERVSIVAIATNLLVNGYLIVRFVDLSGTGGLDGSDATMVWAKVLLWAIPLSIGLTIVLNVLFAFLVGERVSDSTMDERDRLFRLRGMSVTTIVFGLGLIASLFGLAFGWKPLTGIIAIFVSATIADLIGNSVRLVSYRLSS